MEPTTPPGDIPLIEGLGAEWNEIVSAIPEDQRAVFAPKLKERISSYEPLKQWEDLHKSGITPSQAGTALDILAGIENNPREIYDTLGKHLGITPAEAKQVVKELEETDDNDPRYKTLKQQVDTLTEITLKNRQMSIEQQQLAEQEAALETELSTLKTKYGNDIPEDEILMRMLHKQQTAEEAYQEYTGRVAEIQKRRPAPLVMSGTGGAIPSRAIDPTKLDSKETKNLVAQMLDHARAEERR